MPVGVVRADADQRHTGPDRAVEARVLVGGPVVRDLDDVDRRDGPDVGPHPALRCLPEVAEQQRGGHPLGSVAPRDAEHDARVVARRRRARPRPQRLEPEQPEVDDGPRGGPEDLRTRGCEPPDHPFVRGASGGADEGGRHRGLYRCDGTDVVAVEVRHHEQVDPVDVHQVETRPQPLRFVPGVDECDGPARAEEDRVALPDVARRDRPVAGHRPAHHEPGNADRTDPDHQHHAGREQQGDPAPAPDEHGDRDARPRDGRECDADDPGRPRRRRSRQGGRRLGDPADRGRRHPGDGREHTGALGPKRREEARGETDHRDHRCEGFREQVRRHPVGRHHRCEQDRHRPARHLRDHGHGQRGGDRRPEPAGEERGERRGEHDDPGGREHGQRERERPRVPGVDDEHADHGEGDERDAADRTPGQVHDEDDDRHHGGPDDRGIRADQHDEAEQERHRDRCPRRPRETARATQQHHEPDDHGAVRPGYSYRRRGVCLT